MEIKAGWDVKGSGVEWGVGLGAMCETGYCVVLFTHSLEFLMVFNIDSSTMDSTLCWVLIE
jgi:hypothetical protein